MAKKKKKKKESNLLNTNSSINRLVIRSSICPTRGLGMMIYISKKIAITIINQYLWVTYNMVGIALST